ncbi:MAG: hypothetical protein CL920_33045 [Deltaproteobacteria bacterium]|nr:hypothetical protein [Deltaproteobacteria bacterium]MBU53550.1 hypothetical protein [Deltaproteobacteria bacterium]
MLLSILIQTKHIVNESSIQHPHTLSRHTARGCFQDLLDKASTHISDELVREVAHSVKGSTSVEDSL